jgi:hypothetical protein
MPQSTSRFAPVTYLRWVLVVLSAGYLAAAWLWKPAFIWGDGAAPYWLLIAMDWTVVPLTVVSVLSSVVACVIWLVPRLPREAPARVGRSRAGCC